MQCLPNYRNNVSNNIFQCRSIYLELLLYFQDGSYDPFSPLNNFTSQISPQMVIRPCGMGGHIILDEFTVVEPEQQHKQPYASKAKRDEVSVEEVAVVRKSNDPGAVSYFFLACLCVLL